MRRAAVFGRPGGGVDVLAGCPGLCATSGNLQSALKEGARRRRRCADRWRDVLATGEVALALISAARRWAHDEKLDRLLAVDAGFDRAGPEAGNGPATAQLRHRSGGESRLEQTLDRVRRCQGVESAAVGTAIPLTGHHSRNDITIEELAEAGSYPHPDIHIVSETMRRRWAFVSCAAAASRLRTRERSTVAMVNATVAQRLFPGIDPLASGSH